MKVICGNKHAVGRADRLLYGHFLEHFHRQIVRPRLPLCG